MDAEAVSNEEGYSITKFFIITKLFSFFPIINKWQKLFKVEGRNGSRLRGET